MNLRCECGASACTTPITISADDYRGAVDVVDLLVTPAHLDGADVIGRRALAWATIEGPRQMPAR